MASAAGGDGGAHAKTGTTVINCWSTPRALSTALMYSFDQRPDCRAVDEPLYAHHLTQVRVFGGRSQLLVVGLVGGLSANSARPWLPPDFDPILHLFPTHA